MTETLTARTIGGLQVQRADEITPSLNFGVHGDSGIGKTLLGGSAAVVEGMYPMLDIDLEDGSETLRRKYPNVDIVRVKNARELQAVYDELHFSKTHGYKSCMLDSTTELDEYVMGGVLLDKKTLDPEADAEVPEWPEHRKRLIRMRKIIRAFRDLPLHTVFLSLTKHVQDKKTGITTAMPSHGGQFIYDYPALLDVILYYYSKVTNDEEGNPVEDRYLLTQRTERALAKDRTNTLPMVVKNPTMQMLYDYMWDKEDNAPKAIVEPEPEPPVPTVEPTSSSMEIDL